MDTLMNLFLRDSKKYIDLIIDSLIFFEKNPTYIRSIDAAFRAAHSIKTESSYLDFQAVTAKSVEIENKLENLKSGREGFSSGIKSECKKIIDLTEQLRCIVLKIEKENSASKTHKQSVFEKPQIETEVSEDEDIVFTDFQKKLLNEGLHRGERFFKIVCKIDEETIMKYPRLYLIVNNLELHTNLLGTVPDVEELEKGLYTKITCYVTTIKSYSEIHSILNVDEVKNITIEPLFEDVDITATVVDATDRSIEKISEEPQILVKIEKIDFLLKSIRYLKNHIERGNFLSSEIKEQLAVMEKVVQELRMVKLENQFKGLSAVIRKIAYDEEKDVEVIFNDNNLEIDRRLFEIIYDPLMHLLKNAVSHGIESSAERIEKGKSAKGSIKCITSDKGGFLIIEVSDDGCGINLNKIAEKTGYTVTELKDPKHLAKVLATPGLTTRKEVDLHSGRGFGFNLIYKKISEIDGTSLTVKTEEGKGTTVTMAFPRHYIYSE